MSCLLTDTTLVVGVDYELDLENGRIRFKSTGTLGPTLDTFLAGGGCGVEVDYCGSMPLHIPCPSKINECLPCDDDPILNISAEAADSDRFLFNFNQTQRPPLAFRFEQLGCKRWCWSDVSQQDADLCAIRQVEECLNDALFGGGSLIPPFPPPQSPALFFNTAQVCTTFCPDGTSFGAVIQAGLVEDRNQVQADRIAHALACRLSALERVCIRTKELPPSCLGDFYSLQLMGLGGIPFHVTFDNFDTLSGMCGTDVLQPNDSFPYIWSATGLPTGLSLSPCSGILSGTPTQSGSFNVTLRAQDSLGSFQTKTLTLTVVNITNAAQLPDGMVGSAYSHAVIVNPTGTYFFQFFSGSPPEWLSLNSATGKLTGTPDAVDTFVFELSVESADGTQCKKQFTLNVTASCAITTNSPLPDATKGDPYSKPLLASGPPPVQWTATGLPSGLSLGIATGIISGTPTVSGDFMVAVHALFNDASSCDKNFTLHVVDATDCAQLPGTLHCTDLIPAYTASCVALGCAPWDGSMSTIFPCLWRGSTCFPTCQVSVSGSSGNWVLSINRGGEFATYNRSFNSPLGTYTLDGNNWVDGPIPGVVTVS